MVKVPGYRSAKGVVFGLVGMALEKDELSH